MSRWYEVSLGDISTQKKGINYTSEGYTDRHSGHPFITIKCFVKGGGYEPKGIKYYRGFFNQTDFLKQNNILFSVTDLTRAGDIVGSPLKVPDFGNTNPAVASMDCMNIIPDQNLCNQDFLYHRLMLSDIRRQMVAYSAGSTVLHLDTKKVPEMKIKIPVDINEQGKIAVILNRVDTIIQKTEALIHKYQQIKAGLMHDLFTRGVTEDGRLCPSREQAPELYKETPIGWIPKEWVSCTLDSVIRIIDCKHYTPKYCSEGYPIIRPRNVNNDGLDFKNVDYISKADYHFLTDIHEPCQGDIVYSRNASFGIPCYVEDDRTFAIGQDVVIMTKMEMDTRFLYYVLKSNLVWNQISRLFAGSTFSRINLGDIRKFIIPRPSGAELLIIVNRLKTIDDKINIENQSLTKLFQKKRGLMHDLLTGKVSVKIDQKETAHV